MYFMAIFHRKRRKQATWELDWWERLVPGHGNTMRSREWCVFDGEVGQFQCHFGVNFQHLPFCITDVGELCYSAVSFFQDPPTKIESTMPQRLNDPFLLDDIQKFEFDTVGGSEKVQRSPQWSLVVNILLGPIIYHGFQQKNIPSWSFWSHFASATEAPKNWPPAASTASRVFAGLEPSWSRLWVESH